MKFILDKFECYIKDVELPSDFDFMNENEKWNYIYNNKLLHREDGPAAIWSCGTKWWFLNGLKHRLNGPAVIWSDGTKWWYLNDIFVEEVIYKGIQNSSKEELLVDMIDSKYKYYLSLIEYRLNQ